MVGEPTLHKGETIAFAESDQCFVRVSEILEQLNLLQTYYEWV